MTTHKAAPHAHPAILAGNMKLLVACTRPRGETSRKAAQRQEFAARQLGVLAGPDGDPAARAAMGPAGAVPALLALLEHGTDKGAWSLILPCGRTFVCLRDAAPVKEA